MQLRALFHDDLTVPWGSGPGQVQGRLLAEALAVAAHLRTRAGPTQAPTVALACRTVTTFAPAFLGAVAASASVHLLPNTQSSTLKRAAENTDFLLHDVSESAHLSDHGVYLPPILTATNSAGEDDGSPATCDGARILLSTSGTTGAAAQSIKSIAQLISETEALLPLLAGTRSVLATVPVFHLFGLLFGLLVPLRLGARVVQDPGFFLSDIAEAIRKHDVNVLVSTPAHLGAMLQAPMPKGLRVFSSGARLSDVLHYALLTTHDWRITDVLGSTETGGIATRDQPRASWKPLPGVSLTAGPADRTMVRSPWCDGGELMMKDIVHLRADGTFTHEGRSDDVVKVAGKRASLAALEELLRTLDGVTDAAVWQDSDSPGEARLRYAIAGSGVTREAIIAAVSREFDPVFVPRQVVFVPDLPREATGKLPKENLEKLFRTRTSTFVTQLRLSTAADGSIECTLPANLIFFQGHFTGLPILPGAVLLDRLVVPAARIKHPDLGPVAGLQRIRLVKNVCPSQHVSVQMTREDLRVTFEVKGAGGTVATGVIQFRASVSS